MTLACFSGRGALALPVVALALATAGPARAESLTAAYAVRLLGLNLGTATLRGQFSPDTYKIEAYANLTGLASAMSGAKGGANASGVIRDGKPASNGYSTSSSNAKETRTVRIGLNAGTVRAVDITPPFEDQPGRVPLQESHKRNVVDPLSALVMPVAGTAPLLGPAACARTIPVFDGYTRFDVPLTYVGLKQVSTRGYSGQVVVCSARYRPLAGHRPNRKATQFMMDNRDMDVWLAPLPNARVLAPYRISVKTMIGMTVIEAQRFIIEPSSASADR